MEIPDIQCFPLYQGLGRVCQVWTFCQTPLLRWASPATVHIMNSQMVEEMDVTLHPGVTLCNKLFQQLLWGLFVLALCFDAQWEASNCDSQNLVLQISIFFLPHTHTQQLLQYIFKCGLSQRSTLACYACPPKDKPPNITSLTACTIVGRALGALWCAKHTISQCGQEDERAAAVTGKPKEYSERKQAQQQREVEKCEDQYTKRTLLDS